MINQNEKAVNTLTARLITSRQIAIDKSFSFYDLPIFLKSLSPSRIDIGFQKSVRQGSIIYLTLYFPDDISTSSIALFKETLVRSEVELDIDCQFLDEKTSPCDILEWVSGAIEPDSMELPSGKKIAVTITLIDVAAELFRQATLLQTDLCYLVSLEQALPDPEDARKLVPSLAEIQGKRTTPIGLEDAVKLSFDLLRCGGWSSHEQICIPRNESALHRSRIEFLVRNHLNNSISFIPGQLLNFYWDDYPVLGLSQNQLQKKVARLRKPDFIDQIFHRLLPSNPNNSVITKSFEDTNRFHDSHHINGNYAFISYAHTNKDFVEFLLNTLNAKGVRYWYDSKIPTGSCWDEELECKIRNAGVLIACVSDAYQESKYCRRELKFADLIGKVILPVAPSKWTWGTGLQLMFQEIHVTRIGEKDETENFYQTLQTVAPQVFIG